MILKIQEGSKLIMVGDSVTDCERARPVGEGLFGATGKGYVGLVDGLLQDAYPERKIRVVNMGCSGDTIWHVNGRWQTDVVDQKPDWVSIMIGVNDVWRQFDLPLQKEIHIYIDQYEKILDELVSKTVKTVQGMVLMTPFYIEPNPTEPMRAMIDQYGAVVKRTAEKYGTEFVDTQKAFNRVLEHCHSASLAWDRVHPNINGHMIIAKAFLNSVDYSW